MSLSADCFHFKHRPSFSSLLLALKTNNWSAVEHINITSVLIWNICYDAALVVVNYRSDLDRVDRFNVGALLSNQAGNCSSSGSQTLTPAPGNVWGRRVRRRILVPELSQDAGKMKKDLIRIIISGKHQLECLTPCVHSCSSSLGPQGGFYLECRLYIKELV